MESLRKIIFRPQSPFIRADIQALRAIAVLSVVIYHIAPTRLIGGFMGVDVFFVISGYLMTLTIMKGIDTAVVGGKKSGYIKFLFSFYAKRIKRLAPAALLCLVAVFTAIMLLKNISLRISTFPQILASSAFLQNIYLLRQSTNYFAASASATAVQHFWSLSLEEQFYMFWPIFLLVITLLTLRIKRGNPKLIIVSLFVVTSFLYGFQLTRTAPTVAYFHTLSRIWELALGGIIVFMPKVKHNDLKLLLPWLGAAMIAYPILKWTDAGFPGWHALMPTIGTLLVIYGNGGGISSNYSLDNLSRFRPAQFFGDISYSLYLYHWSAIVLAPYMVKFEGRNLKIFILAISFALAFLSYKLVEQPTRKLKIKPRFVYAAGAFAMALVMVPTGVVYNNSKLGDILQKSYERAIDPNDTGFGARATYSSKYRDKAFGKTNLTWASYAQAKLFGTTVDNPEYVTWDSYNLHEPYKPSDSITEFGDLNAEKTILLVAGSHMQHWCAAFDVVGKELGYKIIYAVNITRNQGLFEVDTSLYGETYLHNGVTGDYRLENERFKWIKENLWSQADYVVTSFWYIYDDINFAEGLKATYENIKNVTGHKPILIQDSPNNVDTDNFSSKYLNHEDFAQVPNFVVMNSLRDKLLEISSPDLFDYFEIESLFIDENGYFHTQVGGVPVFYDLHHLTPIFSYSAGEYFTKYFRSLLERDG